MHEPETLPSDSTAEGPAAAIGTVVGGRFRLEQHIGSDLLGDDWLARDQKTDKPLAVWMLSPACAEPAIAEAIRHEVRIAATLQHRSLVAIYGIGTHGTQLFIAREAVRGERLSELLARSAGGRPPLGLRGAYNLVAHLAKALAAVHGTTCHAAVRPSAVWITKSGRVKLGDLGLSLALVRTGQTALLGDGSGPFLAPEVRRAEPATAASDLYGIGAVLHALLTGKPPSEPPVPLSQAHPDANPALESFVRRCLAAGPGERFPHIEALREALLALVPDTREPARDELAADLELDVDVALSLAPPAPNQTRGPADPARPPAARDAAPPRPAQPVRDVLAAPARPDRPPPPRPEPPDPDQAIAALTAKLTQDDAPRWMGVKDGLDHGPFTARELIKLIVSGEIRSEHLLLNMSTYERKPLREWDEFGPFVDQYKLRKAEADHATALERSARIERGSTAAKLLILVGSIAVLLLAGGGYLMSRGAAKKSQAADHAELLTAFESGQVKISGTAGILKPPPRRTGNRPRPPRSRGGGFASYNDAMNQPMELGDATRGGGERQLRSSDIAGVMNRKLNNLFGCVTRELRSGGRLGSVQIDLAILGDGRVAGASVNTGSPAFKKCVVGKVRQISFPSFPAPRMGARYSFDVD